LRLDVEADAKRDRGGYAVIVAGSATESELITRVASGDDSLRMPPPATGKPLAVAQVQLLRQWVAQGARWARHWAYVPPTRHPVPAGKPEDRARNWVDRFIHARLRAEGLPSAAEADRRTLARRLSFDLTGLPPRPADVDRFVHDPFPGAYERYVDRLLASPHYGERMAVYWLDLVRYADTVGYHGDQDHNISPYRDYVIDAFNENVPFDRFTHEQLAGDLLPDAGIDGRIASGYHRLLQTSHEGGVQPREYLAIYAADRVRNVSAVWMAATLGCAQCHDHKYDPYTSRDFYSLAAILADIDEAEHFRVGTNSLPTARPPEIEVLSRRERRIRNTLTRRRATWQRKLATAPSEDQTSLHRQLLTTQRQLQDLEDSRRKTMVTVALPEPRTIRLLPRGNWLDESGPVMQPAVPAVLGRLPEGLGRTTRLDLARWLTDPDHGIGRLTARVMVNRFWYLCFGRGLTGSLDDFGGQGEPPTWPRLLDNLALEFVRSGWDVKHMVRLLVTSRTYRQGSDMESASSIRDPDNRWFARQSRFRLPAEMVRDGALAISGLLNERIGGAGVRPYQPAGYYRHLNFPQRTYRHHDDPRQWRRGVYVHWQRQFLHPMLRAFDAPRREECTAARPRSNTPLAALVLLNDPTFVEAARVFAARILEQGGDSTPQKIRFAFRQAVSRSPDSVEQNVLSGLLQTSRDYYRARPAEAAQLLRVGLANPRPVAHPITLAAWTTVARAILNLGEVNTRE
jgi:hypothetical protein